MGTGVIVFLNIANLTEHSFIQLPVNYSDPRALVVDELEGNLYVGMNGGGAILKINLYTQQITGYQNTPFYLDKIWAGLAAPDHVYFTTNEQHAKVFRVAKTDLCTNLCAGMFQYCKAGKCVCPPEFEMHNNQCRWPQLAHDEAVMKREKGGEIALGIFFTIAVIAAAAGWYMVWKGKRGSYQTV